MKAIVLQRTLSVGAALLSLLGGAPFGPVSELNPGVWAGPDLSALPLPVSGYQVYLLGELHGVTETENILLQYLARLFLKTGLRDVAIEEKAVYEHEAQAYVTGRSSAVPEALCLRSGVLQAIRRFNEGRSAKDLIRVHLVDIDSPATAIREHLLAIKGQVAGAATVHVPDAADIKQKGAAAADQLKGLTANEYLLGELRTVEHSIGAYRHGLEVGTREVKGSPYLDDREEAVSQNIQDLVRHPDCRGVLALYGFDHVSKARRKDGGENREQEFSPLALRLEQAGVRVFSIVTFPLSGRSSWRGHEGEIPWTASDGRLENGESLDRVLAAVPGGTLLYVDPKRQRIRLPSQDVTAFLVDAFLLLPRATAMENHCVTR